MDGSARFSGLNTIPTSKAVNHEAVLIANCPIVEPPPTGPFPVTPAARAQRWRFYDHLGAG